MKLVREFSAENVVMGRLEKGADIIRSIEDFCGERGITAAWIQLIGALEKATISYYDQEKHQYFHRELNGDYEIVSCSGNISMKDGKPFAHLHVALSDTDYKTLGGHLWPDSSAVFAAEFVLFELKGATDADMLTRCPDVETGLTLW